jgi:hypothetical protein
MEYNNRITSLAVCDQEGSPMTIIRHKLNFLTLVCLLAVAGFIYQSRPAAAQTASIELNIGKITFLVGGSGGYGQLHVGNRTYPLTVGGITAGATISFSRADLVGTVFNLQSVYDIEGIYTAGTAGLAAAGGASFVSLTNSKGVTIELSGKQIGLDASLDLSGMRISLN